jgi:hypothetical protein
MQPCRGFAAWPFVLLSSSAWRSHDTTLTTGLIFGEYYKVLQFWLFRSSSEAAIQAGERLRGHESTRNERSFGHDFACLYLQAW